MTTDPTVQILWFDGKPHRISADPPGVERTEWLAEYYAKSGHAS